MKVSAAKQDKDSKAQRHSLRPRYSRNIDQGIVTETVLKLFFSLVIGVSGLTSLIKLVPYHNAQLAKLKEVRTQVQETQVRVLKLRQELNRNFDPQQTQNLIEEYSSLTVPDRLQVFVRERKNSTIGDSQIVSKSKTD